MSRGKRLALLAAATVALLLFVPFVGAEPIGWSDIFGDGGGLGEGAVDGDAWLARQGIFWRLRVPRTLVAALAGSTLALGGVAFQAMFRNALAEPFVLGVSAGASAGVAATIVGAGAFSAAGFAAAGQWFDLPGPTVGGFVGALTAITAVYAVSRLRGGMDTPRLLLAGVALSFFFSSLVMLLQYLAAPREAARLARALMGGVATAGYGPVAGALPLALAGAATVFFSRRELDLFACGEDLARTRGVDVARVRRRLFFGVSLMTATVTALCGPIGFVGLMAPHACRRMVGPAHRYLAPASALSGAAFLASADALGRWAAAPAEVPVGLVTSLVGGPFFLWLLLRGGPSDGGV